MLRKLRLLGVVGETGAEPSGGVAPVARIAGESTAGLRGGPFVELDVSYRTGLDREPGPGRNSHPAAARVVRVAIVAGRVRQLGGREGIGQVVGGEFLGPGAAHLLGGRLAHGEDT